MCSRATLLAITLHSVSTSKHPRTMEAATHMLDCNITYTNLNFSTTVHGRSMEEAHELAREQYEAQKNTKITPDGKEKDRT